MAVVISICGLIAALAAALRGLIYFNRQCLRPAAAWVINLSVDLRKILPVLVDISRQVDNNGGSSLKDQISAIRQEMTDMHKEMTHQSKELSHQSETLRGIHTRLSPNSQNRVQT